MKYSYKLIQNHQANLGKPGPVRLPTGPTFDFEKRCCPPALSAWSEYTGEEVFDDAVSRREQTVATIARQEAIIKAVRLILNAPVFVPPLPAASTTNRWISATLLRQVENWLGFTPAMKREIVVSRNADDSAFIPDLWATDKTMNRKAWVTVDHGGNEYEWQGYVHRVESDIDRVTRTVDVVVEFLIPFTPGTRVQLLELPVQLEASC